MNASSTSLFAAASSARTVVVLVTLLVVLGVVMATLTVWLVVSTRPDREALAPLEVMSERRWLAADTATRNRALEEVRPSSDVWFEEELIVEPAPIRATPGPDAVGAGAEPAPTGGRHGENGDRSGDSTPSRGIGVTEDAFNAARAEEARSAPDADAEGDVPAADDATDDADGTDDEGKVTH